MPSDVPDGAVLISDLFRKDPLHLTRADKTAIVKHYRRNRALWVAAGTRAPPTKKAAGPREKVTGISLDELDL